MHPRPVTTKIGQKSTIFVTKISNERISASFYRLLSFEMYVREQMRNSHENKKFVSFFVILDQKCFYKKTRKYIEIYIQFKRSQRGVKLTNFKKTFFWEFTSNDALDLAYWFFDEIGPKIIFLPFCLAKNTCFSKIAKNRPQNRLFTRNELSQRDFIP